MSDETVVLMSESETGVYHNCVHCHYVEDNNTFRLMGEPLDEYRLCENCKSL